MVDRRRIRRALVWAARLGVAATFCVAAVPKLEDPAAFAEAISNYQAFPYWTVNLLAGFVPALELVGAAALVTGFKRDAGAFALAGLTVGFIALIASVIYRGIDIGCGCFGQVDTASQVGWPLLWRDLGLLGAIVVAALRTDTATVARPD